MKKYVIAIVLAACSADETTTPTAPAVPAVATSTLLWPARIAADIDALDAAKRDALFALAPDGPRFKTDAIHDPRVAAVFLDRLARMQDPEPVRAALAEALPRTGGLYADAVADLFGKEGSATVRAAFVVAARRAPMDEALSILRRGFADPAIEVRTEAARSAADQPAGARLAAELRMATTDAAPALRAEAVRSIGILKIQAARDELARALNDGSADVRLEAMHALDRIAPGSLAGTAAIAALTSDTDARVSALAQKLSARTTQ